LLFDFRVLPDQFGKFFPSKKLNCKESCGPMFLVNGLCDKLCPTRSLARRQNGVMIQFRRECLGLLDFPTNLPWFKRFPLFLELSLCAVHWAFAQSIKYVDSELFLALLRESFKTRTGPVAFQQRQA
jgi:hypothetical protein